MILLKGKTLSSIIKKLICSLLAKNANFDIYHFISFFGDFFSFGGGHNEERNQRPKGNFITETLKKPALASSLLDIYHNIRHFYPNPSSQK